MTQSVISSRLGQYNPPEILYTKKPTLYDKTTSFFQTQTQGILAGVRTTVSFALGATILNGGIHLINQLGAYQLLGKEDPIRPFGYEFSILMGTFTTSLFLVNQAVMPIFREYLRGSQPSEAKLALANVLAYTTASIFGSQITGRVLSPFVNAQVGNTEFYGSIFFAARSQLNSFVRTQLENEENKNKQKTPPPSDVPTTDPSANEPT